MSAFFLDSSALVKRYAPEVGSGWVTSPTDAASAHDILLAEITLVEVAAAISMKARTPGGLTPTERDQAMSVLQQDCRDRFTLIPTNRRIFDLAVDLTQRHPLRAYDAVQLASAMLTNSELVSGSLAPLTFVSSDRALLAAAGTDGLSTEDPMAHP